MIQDCGITAGFRAAQAMQPCEDRPGQLPAGSEPASKKMGVSERADDSAYQGRLSFLALSGWGEAMHSARIDWMLMNFCVRSFAFQCN